MDEYGIPESADPEVKALIIRLLELFQGIISEGAEESMEEISAINKILKEDHGYEPNLVVSLALTKIGLNKENNNEESEKISNPRIFSVDQNGETQVIDPSTGWINRMGIKTTDEEILSEANNSSSEKWIKGVGISNLEEL